MKRLLPFVLISVLSFQCYAAGWDFLFMQRNAADNGNLTRVAARPASGHGVFVYDVATLTMMWLKLDSGFTVSGSNLSVAAPTSVPWSVVTGAPTIPTKTSDLTNDSGFITSAPVTSVNSQTGAVTLTYTSVGAASAVHSHVISDVTGLTTELNDRVLTTDARLSNARTPLAHTHVLADVTNAGTAAALNVASSGDAASGEIVKGNDTRLTNARTPTTHNHTLSQITDAGTAAALNVPSSGDANSAQVVKGNDSRLSDSRTPIAHTHVAADISNFNPAVDARVVAGITGKFNNPTGTTAQYLRGDGTVATFPTIPAAQVNSDWNATSGVAQILNKPAIQAIQRVRAQTNTSGVYTWTFPSAYGSGTTPVISLTVEDGTSSTWNHQVTAISNTSVTIQLQKTNAVTILGISVLGIAATPQAYVHLTAVAP